MLLAACCANPALPKEEPLWEYGLGVGAVAFEDYRGSDTSHVYPLPVPYVLYNGAFLKADRDGVRGTLFNQDRVGMNLSFNLTTPVRNDRERRGMPDLRPTVEIGPSLELHLLRSDDARIKFDLRMPLRAAFTVEAAPRMIGWTFTPRFNLDVADPMGIRRLALGIAERPRVRRPALQRLFLYGRAAVCDGGASCLPGGRRLRRHADDRRLVETLS